MNILILSWRGPGHPHEGGAEIVIHEHAKAWIKSGHSVTLFTSIYKGGKAREVIDGIEILRMGNEAIGVKLQAFWWYSVTTSQKFDLVIDNFHGLPFFSPLYVKTTKIAFIHEVAKEVWQLNPLRWPWNKVVDVLGTTFEPLIFKFFYRNVSFITVSESTKSDLIEWKIFRKNIHVIHNGVNLVSLGNNFKKERKKTLIFLGALTKDKGVEDAISVFALVSKRYKECQLWIVGRGEKNYIKYLQMQVRHLGVKSQVKFFGFVSQNEKFKLLSKAHIMINCSVREGWGLVNIEANSVGTPVVGYKVQGLKDSIKNNYSGILCKPNIKSCAQVVMNLFSDEIRLKQLSETSVRWSKRFDWKSSTEKSLKLITSLVRT
jgi:glycosyltransferase involved in cell wall biosynthesis